MVGYADRIDTLQAAVLAAKLASLAEGNEKRRALAAAYNEKLTGLGDLSLPPETPNRRSVYHLYVVRTKQREELLAHLNAKGIGAGIHYPVPVHLQPAYAFLGHKAGEFPQAEAWADECLSLPIYPELTESSRTVSWRRSGRSSSGAAWDAAMTATTGASPAEERSGHTGPRAAHSCHHEHVARGRQLPWRASSRSRSRPCRQLGAEVDVEVVAQSRGRRDYLLAAPRIRRRVREGNYDVVHIHHGMVALACRFIGPVPRVLGLYGHDVNWHWQRWITRIGWGGVAAKLYISRRMAVAAGESDGLVIPNGVDFNVFAPGRPRRGSDEARVRRRRPSGAVRRCPEQLGKGLRRIHRRLDRTSGSRTIRRRAGTPEPGQSREEVAAKFLAADVLLFTSRKGFEGSPTVVKEATAIGLPVVTTDVGDVAEVLSGVTLPLSSSTRNRGAPRKRGQSSSRDSPTRWRRSSRPESIQRARAQRLARLGQDRRVHDRHVPRCHPAVLEPAGETGS